jgi:acetolactate synthase-1/2/3 large subunit
MKLSDYVAQFLADRGITHVFAISGGASLHLIHSVHATPGIDFICPQHEQAAAMAADAYARVTGRAGAAMATSGPGATNMLTGVCCAYYDSVPAIFITGQVSTFRMKGDNQVRQVGFQETDTIDVYRPVTKYTVQILDHKQIRYELEKAYYLAHAGRPGPVLIDIPDNIQREQIDPASLVGFTAPAPAKPRDSDAQQLEQVAEMLAVAMRPVIVLGWGVRLAHAEQEVFDLLKTCGAPVAPTWAAADLLPYDHPQLIGTFGTHGTRYANFAIQNADLVLSIGSRLDTKATGTPLRSFAREARKIVVDIDPGELAKFDKFGLDIDLRIAADAREFLQQLAPRLAGINWPDLKPWLARIAQWKRRYPICPDEFYAEQDVNPYVLVKSLSRQANPGDTIIVDTGCALAWTMQAFEFKAGQRLYHDFNNTAMGWSLPAAIGAAFAQPGKPVLAIVGDGSLQMTIQELATIIRHQLPIKIFVINNHGYSMIQQTQDQWLGSDYLASSVDGGLASPDFVAIARAYGFPTHSVAANRDLPATIRAVLDCPGPCFCNVEISPRRRVVPQVKFGRPNEDSEPLLARAEFIENMIVKPLDVSLQEHS